MLTEYPSPSRPRRESLHATLLLLMVHPLHADATALEALAVSPHGLAEVLWAQRSPAVLHFRVPCSPQISRFGRLGVRFVIGARGRRNGGRRGRQVGLFLIQPLDPLALHAACALNDVTDEDLGDSAHSYYDILGHGLGDSRVDKLSRG